MAVKVKLGCSRISKEPSVAAEESERQGVGDRSVRVEIRVGSYSLCEDTKFTSKIWEEMTEGFSTEECHYLSHFTKITLSASQST